MVIYVIENKINGMKYVGQTVGTSKERWRKHIYDREKGYRISRAIKKYGPESFVVYDIDTAKTQEELDKKEIYWIKELNTLSPNGYNLTSGGRFYHYTLSKDSKTIKFPSRLGKPCSEETKWKISQSHIGKYNGEKNPNYGKHWSDEWKKKVSEKHKEYYKTHDHPEAIKVLCVETGVIYKSATEASRQTGIDNSHIGKACRGILKRSGGYHWKYADEGVDSP